MEMSSKILEILNSPVRPPGAFAMDDIINPLSENPSKNPMEIAGVLHCVFGFLPLPDIKECRCVCREWNHVAEPFLRKLSRISFSSHSCISATAKSPSNFSQTFTHSGTKIPFTAFGIQKPHYYNRAHFPESTFINFFTTWGKNMKDLKFDNLKIKYYRTVYDLSELLVGLHLTKLTITYPKRDHRLRQERALPLWKFPLDTVVHIKYLHLRRCSLRCVEGIRISPFEIDLKDCEFVFPNKDDKTISNYICFDSIKRCTIHDYLGKEDENIIKLDLTGNIAMDKMDLSGINVINWRSSLWKVNHFLLAYQLYDLGNSQMDIKQLDLKGQFMSLEDIPRTVEVLTVDEYTFFSTRTRSYSLPNLRYLRVFAFASFFKKSLNLPNLIYLDLNYSYFPILKRLALKSIPNTVRKLRVNVESFESLKVIGKATARLDKLVVNGVSLPDLQSILAKLKTQKIVFKLYCGAQKDFINSPEALKFLKMPYESIAIGPMFWDLQTKEFGSSLIAPLVEEKSEYYLFKGKKGTALGKSEFDKMMELW